MTGTPDPKRPNLDSVTIEERDPALVLDAMGTRTALPGVKGFYPAFDITPPKLCDGVVTGQGRVCALQFETRFHCKMPLPL